MVDIPDKDLLAPGHRGCAGCGASIAVKLALNALGENTVAISATGCLEVMTTPYPESSWEVPFIHVAFENSGAVASGVESALRIQGKDDVNVVAFGGDGGTVDIGLQSLSGAMERGHNMLYICYDNEAYMNTGIQGSASTPKGGWSTTTPAGKLTHSKDLLRIAMAHDVPYAASASIANLTDMKRKVKKAREVQGTAVLHIQCPCPTGWGYSSAKSIELCREALQSGAWLLLEFEDGKLKINQTPKKLGEIEGYTKLQKRFRGLSEEQMQNLKDSVIHRYNVLKAQENQG